VSFLNQLKAQANAVQAAKSVAQTQAQIEAQARLERTETACNTTWTYLSEMAHQLNILAPDGPKFSVDGKTPWPSMKLVDFRVDFRKKTLSNRELFSSMGIGWEVVPSQRKLGSGRVTVNFLPELKKVEARLAAGNIEHQRFQVRHAQTQSIQAITFEYRTQAHASISVKPDHDLGELSFRFSNVSGLAVQIASWSADLIQESFLDELAKLVMSRPSRLFPTPD